MGTTPIPLGKTECWLWLLKEEFSKKSKVEKTLTMLTMFYVSYLLLIT